MRRKALQETGLEVDGDPLTSFSLRGILHGMAVVLKSQTNRNLPGASDQERTVCVVDVDVALPDMIVCRKQDVDTVMGPLPAVAPAATGEDAFDALYTVFVSAGPLDSSGDFRTPAVGRALRWAKPPVLEQLRIAHVGWIRVQRARCEVALPPVDSGNAPFALAVALNVALAARDRPLVPAVPRREASAVDGKLDMTPLYVGGGVAAFGLFIGWAPVSFTPWVREATEEWVCGPGARLLVTSSSDGASTSYGLYCSGATSDDLFLHYFTSGALFIGVALAVTAVIFAATWWRRPALEPS
jgi:hypothetical protein